MQDTCLSAGSYTSSPESQPRPQRCDVLRLARVFLLGLEQRRGHQQTPVEQLPFGADFDRLVLLRPEDLVRIAVERGRQATILRAGAIEFGADRVRRRRIGRIDAAIRQRLQRQAEVEVRHAVLLLLRARTCSARCSPYRSRWP